MLIEKKSIKIYGNHIVFECEFSKWNYDILKQHFKAALYSQCDTKEVSKKDYEKYIDMMYHDDIGSYVDVNPNYVLTCDCNLDATLFMYKTKAIICVEIEQFTHICHGGFELDYL